MVEILRDIRLNVHLLVRVFQHQSWVFLKNIKIIIFMIALSIGQLNDTRGYQIKPTNFTCNMISCFRLKGPCLSGSEKKHFFVKFIYCGKWLSKKNICIKLKTKKCTPKFALLWEFPSVYIYWLTVE